MNSLTWLHFSDIHICNPKSGWEADGVLEKLQEDLKRLLHDHNLKPDFIVFTGDAVYGHLGNDKGKKISDQFESAAILFNEICSLYDPPVPQSHFFIVPGNHEINRLKVPGMIHEGLKASLSNKSHDEMEKKLAEMLRDNTNDLKALMVSLEDYKAFLDEYDFVNDLDKDRLIWGKVIEINGIKIGIAGMNSAWSCGMDKHKGDVLLSGHWQIPTLSKKIKDGQIKIAMMHHPVSWLMPFEDTAVKKELGNNFDFFLHGHEHQNWVDEQADGFVTIAAGACYGDSEKDTGYNIVRLFPESGDGEVWLRKYDKDGHWWIPKIIYNKTDNDGIWRIRNWGQRLRKQEKSAQSLKSELISGPTVSKKETSTEHDNRCDIDSQTNSGNTYDDFSPESRGLFGRKKEIAELSRLLDKYQIVTVCGLSGIGKTSLIREACRTESLQNRLYMTLKSHKLISSDEIFRHFSRILGCNDESPDMVFNILKMSEFKELKGFVKDSEPAIIHIEDSHFFFEMTGGTSRFLDSSIKNLFEAIAEYYPQIHIILESRETLSDSILPEKNHKKINIKGIDKESVGQFFIRPFRNEPEKGWHLDENDIELVFKKLGGDSHKEKAHPLAMYLLASVADGMKETPRQVLERYDSTKELHEKLDKRLFNDLYANILTEKAQRMLRICALYNDFIPDSHVTALNKAVNDDDAFQLLLRRYILNIKGEGDRYSLHSLLADLTKKYLENLNDEKLENHRIIADAWLAGLKISNHYSSPNIIATNEALYHLIESGEYTRLHEIQEKLLSRGYIEVLEKKSEQLSFSKKDHENMAVLRLIVKIKPDSQKHHRFLGEVIERVYGRGCSEALQHHEKAYSLNPSFPAYINNLVRCLDYGDKHDDALALIDKAEENGVINDHLYSVKAGILQKIGRSEEASILRMKKIEAGSRHAAFYNEQALYFSENNLNDAALTIIDKAQKKGIMDDHLNLVMAGILQKIGRGDDASNLRLDKINSGSRHGAYYNEEAIYLYNKRDYDAALNIVAKAENYRIMCSHLYSVKARILQKMGRREESFKLRQEKIESGSRDAVYYNDQALYFSQKGQNHDALEIIKKAEVNKAMNDHLYSVKTEILQKMGKHDEASKLRLLKIESGSTEPIFYNAEALHLSKKNHNENALEIINRAEKNGAVNDYSYSVKTGILQKIGRVEEASRLRLERIESGSKNPALYTEEALYLSQKNLYSDALRIITEAEKNGIMNYHLKTAKARIIQMMKREVKVPERE